MQHIAKYRTRYIGVECGLYDLLLVENDSEYDEPDDRERDSSVHEMIREWESSDIHPKKSSE
jgi:hypothetical protein